MRSLLVNSRDVQAEFRDGIVSVTGNSSISVRRQIKSDGITAEKISELQTTYANESKNFSRFIFTLTKIRDFKMTQYSKMLFIIIPMSLYFDICRRRFGMTMSVQYNKCFLF